MKPRKVMIHIEAESDLPLKRIKKSIPLGIDIWRRSDGYFKAHQVTLQVVKENK